MILSPVFVKTHYISVRLVKLKLEISRMLPKIKGQISEDKTELFGV